MKKFAKKLCSIVMALCIILSAVSALSVAAATASTITLDTPLTVTVSDGGYCDLQFTPEESGVYSFYSTGDYDTYGYILNADEEELVFSDYSADDNFNAVYYMAAGQTYILRASLWDSITASFTVVVTFTDIVSVSIEDVSLIENTDGFISEDYNEETGEYDLEYFRYDYSPYFTVYFSDGSSTSNSYGISYNDSYYSFDVYDDQSYENQWTAGNTYKATGKIFGIETAFNVTVEENPVQSLVVQDLTVTEGIDSYTNTYTEWGDDGSVTEYEWQCYDCFPRFTVTFKDGTVIQNDGSGIWYEDEWYNFNFDTMQSYENQWLPGSTHTVTGKILGVEGSFTVTVNENPVESVVFDDITITEYFDSDTWSFYDYETGSWVDWQHYYYNPSYTVYLKDGSALESDENGNVFIGEDGYSPSWQDSQAYESQWTAGNSYEVTGGMLGFEDTFTVTVEKSPVVSVEIEDVTLYEGESLGTDYYYDDETGEEIEWQYYNYWPDFTVTFEDGSAVSGSGGVYYNDRWYSFTRTDDQSYLNKWDIGEHTATGEILGVSDTFTVTIAESPIKSISVTPIEFPEGTHGWWTWDYDDEGNKIDYYRYQWYDYVTVTVEFADGTTTTVDMLEPVNYDGTTFEWTFSNNTQSSYSPWTVGNTYTEETVYLGPCSANVSVKITESPYESIEILSVTPIKETDYSYISESGNKIYNLPIFTYKINFKDGSSLTRQSNYYYEDHRLSWSDSQDYEPWTIGAENTVTVYLGTAKATFSAIITEVSDWEYVEQNGGLFITNCGITDSEITVPDQIDGTPVIGIMSMGDCLNGAEIINLPDSVTYISEDAFSGGYWLYTVNVGANISELDPDAFANCSVCEINVPDSNPNFSTVDGIVYNKSGDTLVVYPLGQGPTYYVPDNVVDANVMLEKDYYSWVTLEFGENCKAFKKVDGVTYSGDMTIVISCDPEKTGSYDMPDSVTTIKEFAFNGSQLSSVTVSDNVSEIVYNAFSYCNNLETISLPDKLTSIGNNAFFASNLKNLTRLPNSLTTIGNNAFADTSLTSMTIPSSVTDIGSSAFAYSTLETLTLSNGLEYIGASAFEGTYIETLAIPNSVTDMGGWAFASTPLKTLTVGTGLYEIPHGAFAYTELTNVTLPKNIEYIGDYAFGDSPVTKVVFKADDIYIGDSAFSGCPLNETTLTNNITGFGKYAFSGNAMTSVKIPDSVTDITYYSFAYSKELASIDIPDNIENIDGHAFEGTAWYEAQEDGVVYLENALYHYKGDIPENTEIIVKNGTVAIADYAFEMEYDIRGEGDGSIIRDVSGLKAVTLPSGVKTIGTYAFYDCINLEKIVIPATVENIEEYAFLGCENLTIYGYEGSYAEDYAYENGIPFIAMIAKEAEKVTVVAPPEVIDQNAELVVEETVTEEVVETIPEEITYTNVKAYDIYFELEGETVQPNGSVTVELEVPEEFNAKYCEVYHIDDNGVATNMNATLVDGKLSFNTTHFSVYAIIENVPAYTSGDINDDGNINNRDYALLMQYLNKWDVTVNEDAADVNRDGTINNRDYALLMQYLNKWDVELK